MDAYGGYEVWEYNVGPHQINEGEVDGEIDFDAYEEDDGEFAGSVDELNGDE
jgi:hypothetical protein